jgi:hypothetical protein
MPDSRRRTGMQQGCVFSRPTHMYSSAAADEYCLGKGGVVDSLFTFPNRLDDAQGNGILRIGDIIRWSPVSTRAESNRMILSFQRGYLPLLRVRQLIYVHPYTKLTYRQYFSSEFIVKSTLSHQVKHVYFFRSSIIISYVMPTPVPFTFRLCTTSNGSQTSLKNLWMP